MMQHTHNRANKAFTLAETLIVVVLVGLFATLMVPVLGSYNEKSSYPALFKASLANLSIVTTEAMTQGRTNLLTYASTRLDTLRVCTNATSQGCWDTTEQGTLGTYESNQGIVLRNGVAIVGLDTDISSDTRIGLRIDINGEKDPNQDGVDQMVLDVCTTDSACALAPFDQYRTDGYPNTPGGLIPITWQSRSLYGSIPY
jgi:type II secretory pathway pseudopilin PulG